MDEILSFESAAEFRAWLKENHQHSERIQLRIFKKASGRATVTYAEALDQALCFGWIDGQRNICDELSWLQRFSL